MYMMDTLLKFQVVESSEFRYDNSSPGSLLSALYELETNDLVG